MYRLLWVFLFVTACGHSDTLDFAVAQTRNVAAPPPVVDVTKPKPPEETGKKPVPPKETPCQGYATAVVSVTYGAGAGFGQNEFPDIVLGPPYGNGEYQGGLDVLSLGRLGEIVLDFSPCLITDGPGPDFIIFENAFFAGGDPDFPFRELATVGASGDGIDFQVFDCADVEYPYEGCAGWQPVYSHPDNGISPFDPAIAGGEAFDLAELVGLQTARAIKITDRGTRNLGGNTVGFDLDAVAVINGQLVE